MTSNIFNEKIPLNRWTSIIIGIFIAILTPLFILQFFAVSREPTLLVVFASMDLFFILVLMNFREQVTEIDSESIKVSFGLIRKKILLGDLLSCEPMQARLGVYSGNGIRLGGDGSLAFLVSMGDAVRLRRKSGRSFVFSTRMQVELVPIINELIEKKAS
jgi:hypothetical protein